MNLLNQNQQEEMSPLLPSGDWDGFFCYNHSPQQYKMVIELAFGNNLISGSGVDDVAPFTWLGNYDLDNYKISMTKSYNTHKVYYLGNVDENGIWGTWKITLDHYDLPTGLKDMLNQAFKKEHNGGFHIWPKKQKSEVNSNETSKEQESLKLKELFSEVFNGI